MKKFLLLFLFLSQVTPILAQEVKQRINTNHHADIDEIQISPNNNYIATGSHDQTIKIWDIRTGKLLNTFYGHEDGIQGIDFSPNSEKLVSGDWDGNVIVWEVKTGKKIKPSDYFDSNLPARVYGISYAPNGHNISITGRSIFIIENDLTISTSPSKINSHNLYPTKSITRHKDIIYNAIFHPTKDIIVTAGVDKTIKVWDVKSGFEIKNIKQNGWVSDIAFSENGKYLFSSVYVSSNDESSYIYKWNTKDYSLEKKIGPARGQIAYSPQGYIATAGNEDYVSLWKINSNEEIKLTAHGNFDWGVQAVDFSQNGNILVSSAGTEVIIWDMAKLE